MILNLKRKKSSKIKTKINSYQYSFFYLFRSEVTPPLNGNENNENETKIIPNTKESPYDAEAKAAKQRELIPYETRIKQFREMLAEKQVNLNSFL